MYTHDIIVIGGGAGGLSVASGAAQLGMKTAVIEREHMGGDCLHFGCVPSKTLIHTAGQFAAARGISRFTGSDLKIPHVNMAAINERISEVVSAIAFHDSPERFRTLGAEVYLGEARFKSPYEVDVDGTVLSSKRIVIATGSRAAVPPVPGLTEAGYLTNRDVFSLPEVPKSLAVLGAGPIGVELGQSFRRLGSEVTVIDMAPRIMPRDDEELAAIIRRQMESEGITIITGAKVSAVEADSHGKTLTIDTGDGASTKTVQASEILVAAGRHANTDTLNLEAAGVDIGRGGVIPVNARLQSNVRHISVIGDANGNFPFTHVAGAEAAVIIRRLALHAGGRMDYRRTPWVSYTDPELATVGHTQESAQQAGITHRIVRQSFAGVDRAHAEEATDGLMKIVLDRKDKVIGVQIASKGAGELIAPALHAVTGGWKFSKFRSAMTPYPTMSEVYGRAVSAELAPKLFNRRIRGILRFLFRYRGSGPSDTGQKEGQQ